MDNSTPIPPNTQAVSYPSANAITLPLFSILISLLLITPFRLLLRVHNIPTTSLIGVIWLSLLFITINSLIWPTEDLSNRFSGHILCDIEVLLRQALYTTMASTTCCITKFLASALDTDNACLYESRAMKRRRVLKDCLFCFAVPVCQVGLHYLVQLNRYTVLTVYGCVDSMDPSWVSVVVFHVWPPIFALLNFYYAVLVIRRLHQHRTNLSSTLSRSSSTTSLSPRRFLKLFLMSLTLLIIYFPILIYYFYLNVSYPFHAYSFSYIHDPLYWPIIVFWQTADAPAGMQYDAWCWVAMGFLVCCFWGWNEEAKELWRGWLVKLGFGRCWPRLRLSARERRECAGSVSGSRIRGSLGSWVDSLDLLGRTLSYFENKEVVKKASFTTSTTLDGGEMTQTPTHTHSHSSHGEFSSSTRKTPLQDHHNNHHYDHDLESSFSSSAPTAPVHQNQADPDAITPLPAASTITRPTTPVSASAFTSPPTTTTPSRSVPVPLFSSFRTHLNPLPLAGLFSSTTSAAAAAKPSHRDHAHGSSDNTNTTATTISAQHKHDHGHRSNSHSHSGDYADIDTDLDSEEPKPGTRAYRERERREMVVEKKERERERLRGEDLEKGEDKGKGKDATAGRLRVEQAVRFGVE